MVSARMLLQLKAQYSMSCHLPSDLVRVDIVLLLPSLTLQGLHAAEQAYIVNDVRAQLTGLGSHLLLLGYTLAAEQCCSA